MKRCFLLALMLVACAPSNPGLSLYPGRALPGEEVEARLSGMETQEARVFVSGLEATVVAREASTLRFQVPSLPGGPKVVRVVAGSREASASLGVLGQVARDRVLLRLPPDQTPRLPLPRT